MKCDDVSLGIPPAWPGQGYGAFCLSSGLLVQFVFLSVAVYYFASAVVWIFVMYLLYSLLDESLLYICSFVGSIENYCNGHHNSIRITCVLRRARYAWWASYDRYYADLAGTLKSA